MAKTLDKILKFFQVSPVQQIVSLGLSAPGTAIYSYLSIENYSQGNTGAGIANAFGVFLNISCFLFNEYLTIEKMQEYKKVKSALDKHCWDERIIQPKSHSWCQRNMVQIASDDAGFGKETRNYFHEKGYKWYHFISNF